MKKSATLLLCLAIALSTVSIASAQKRGGGRGKPAQTGLENAENRANAHGQTGIENAEARQEREKHNHGKKLAKGKSKVKKHKHNK